MSRLPPGHPAPLEVPAPLLDRLIGLAESAAPAEACGLLVGEGRTVVRLAPTSNVALDPVARYAIPPVEHFAILRQARLEGLDVLGAYHSHPRSGAVPSATDTADAFPHFDFLIVGLTPTAHVRVWRLTGGNFTEVGFVAS